MKSAYRIEKKQRPKAEVPALALREFESRIRKIQSNFKDKIDAARQLLQELQGDIQDLIKKRDANLKEAQNILADARRQAAEIINDADGVRHSTLLDVEQIRVRAVNTLAEADRKLSEANQRALSLSLQANQVDAAEARLRNLVKENEYLHGLHAKIEASEARAKDHEINAVAAEMRAKQIWKQDEKTLAEIKRLALAIKQAPFYAAKQRR